MSNKKNQFTFSDDVLKVIDEICKIRGGITREKAIALAIADDLYFVDIARRGGRVFTDIRNGRQNHVQNEIHILIPR